MVQHPEVLWAQRSSESDEEKVDRTFVLIILILVDASFPRLPERRLHHRKPSRYQGIIARVQPHAHIHFFQSKGRIVRKCFRRSDAILMISSQRRKRVCL